MSDTDREAFEAEYSKRHPKWQKKLASAGGYIAIRAEEAWQVWQASRDHYAPKLPPLKDVERTNVVKAYGCGTADHLQVLSVIKALDALGALNVPKLAFREAIEKAGDAVEKLVSRGRYPDDSEFDYALEMSAAAFRAAGVQFKDEA